MIDALALFFSAVDLSSQLPPPMDPLPLEVPWANLTEAQRINKVPLPPVRFRGNNDAAIKLLTPTELLGACEQNVEVGDVLLGCARSFPRQIWMLNPCLSTEQLWAKEFCHELGHVNGWTYKHEE